MVKVARPAGQISYPYARAEQVGRWLWKVWIETKTGPYPHPDDAWLVFGEERAWRKAKRELRKYMSKKTNAHQVYPNELHGTGWPD